MVGTAGTQAATSAARVELASRALMWRMPAWRSLALVALATVALAALAAVTVAALATVAVTVGGALDVGLRSSRAVPPVAAHAHAYAHARVRSRTREPFSHATSLSSLPLTAQGPVSSVLGAHAGAFQVTAGPGGPQASNRGEHLRASFTSAGASITAGGADVGFELKGYGYGYGYGSALVPVAPATPVARGNRVLYSHPGFSEWYLNGPLGIEQGFTIARAPAGRRMGPLTVAMALSGDAKATLEDGGQSIDFTHPGGATLRYTGLTVTDARGHRLRSWLALGHGTLGHGTVLVRVDARGAAYPITVDPLLQGVERLLPTEEEGGSYEEKYGPEGEFGYSVAVSGDGSTLIIGAPYGKASGSGDHFSTGLAYVFVKEGGAWVQQGPELVPPSTLKALNTETDAYEAPGPAKFGASVALSENGNVAAIGGPANGSDDPEAGAPGDVKGTVWFFVRSAGKWTVQQAVGGTTGGYKNLNGANIFGDHVALSANGERAFISGTFGAEGDIFGIGAVWVFGYQGGTWTEESVLTKPLTQKEVEAGANGSEFGESIAVSASGNSLLVGAPGNRPGAPFTASETGTVYAYSRVGSSWVQEQAIAPSGRWRFGETLAMSADGSTALLGEPNSYSEFEGFVYVYTHGSEWAEQARLEPSAYPQAETTANKYNGGFGWSTALSANGNVALVGSPTTLMTVREKGKLSELNSGAVWRFARSGSTWSQQGARVAPAGETPWRYNPQTGFGSAVAMSGDGQTALVGAATDSPLGRYSGSAWTFSPSMFTGIVAPTVVSEAPSGVTETVATMNGTVNPNGYAVEECYFEFGTTTAYGVKQKCSPSEPGAGNAPVAVSAAAKELGFYPLEPLTTYHYRLVSVAGGLIGYGADQSFETAGPPPTVTTGSATGVTQTEAMLAGTVNPNGSNVTRCAIEYGRSLPSGTTVACSPSPGSGTSAVPVSGAASGLSANTTYEYRVIAETGGGSTTGSTATFKTSPSAPTVTTGSATGVTPTEATLNGTVDPNGGAVTKCFIEYGTSLPSSATAPCSPSPGSGTSAVSVSGAVSGLSADTSYEYRVVAENSGGRTTGPTRSFTSSPGAPLIVPQATTGISAVAATMNATVNPDGASLVYCRFYVYGPSGFVGDPACVPTPTANGGAQAVSASISGLAPNTAYTYKLYAENTAEHLGYAAASFMTAAAPPSVTTGAPDALGPSSIKAAGTVNPNNSTVTSCVIEYGTSLPSGASVPCNPSPGSGSSAVAVTAEIGGLNPQTTYEYRVIATSAAGTGTGTIETATTTAPAPTVTTGGASAIASSSAVLHGTVDPNGGEVTSCAIEYGTTLPSVETAPCSPVPGSGTSPIGVTGTATFLTADTTYEYRVVATNAGGTSVGATQMFTTASEEAPTVITGSASSVTHTGATLEATVDPNGSQVTTCLIEFGETLPSGRAVECKPAPGAGTSPVGVSAPVYGLKPAIAYQYRVIAVNAAGTATGATERFSTLDNTPPELGRCVSVQAGRGTYSSSKCTVTGGKDGYEWTYGPANTHLTTKLATGSVTFETVHGTKLKCTGETGGGEYAGLNALANAVLTFIGCEQSSQRCSSSGAAPGEIVTSALTGSLGVEKDGATSASNKLALELGSAGTVLAATCGTTAIDIYGDVLVPVPSNKMSSSYALKFKASKGVQKPSSFVGGPETFLELAVNGGPHERAGLTATVTVTNAEPIEVNSVL